MGNSMEVLQKIKIELQHDSDFPNDSVVQNLLAYAGDQGSNHGLGRSPGEGSGNPLQYPCQHFLFLVCFYGNHSNMCEVISHSCFDLHFPDG